VLLADRAARILITLGGLGTIIAVSLVCVFLVWVVIPLLLPESLQRRSAGDLDQDGTSRAVHLASDDYLNLVWVASADGTIRTYRADESKLLSEWVSPSGKPPVAWSFALRGGQVAYAYADRTVQVGKIEFATSFVPEAEVPDELRQLSTGQIAVWQDGIVERTPEGQLRRQRLEVAFEEPVAVQTEAELVLLDQSISSKGNILAVLTNNGELHVAQVTQRKNLLTGKTTSRLREGSVPVNLPKGELPQYLLLAGLGDSVFLVWRDGLLQRFDTRVVTQPVLVETLNVLSDGDPAEPPPADTQVTSVAFLTGKNSLVCGDSLGRIRVWFRIRPEEAQTPDGAQLALGHELAGAPAAVTALAPSPQSRMLAASYADGSLRLFYVTSEQLLAALPDTGADVETLLTIAPKNDAVISLTQNKLSHWSIAAPHPEATFSSILLPVWYEGYVQPEDVWQSSSGTDDFEEKYGLVPLIFGTIKATFYSMLFGAPLALLAAIYTSEFLHPRIRTRVKPMIEIMASLPSVVLGFLAALVIAPFVEDIVPECLAAFVTLPFTYMLFAYLWQLLPARSAVRARRFRMFGMIAALPIGIWLAFQVGGLVEHWLFAGDIMAWLDGQIGNGIGAWMFLLLPASAAAVFWMSGLFVSPWMRRCAGGWSRTAFAALDLVRFLLASLTALALAYLLSAALAEFLWDPRGTFIGTYIQRNAMIVGFIMGFAIIPIIYTISDDALSAVPESLRAASLGAGATPWQTAIRVVIPTAMSGLFSALMVGLGRAVGETMIVLMAAGNTPIKDWNIFNGFRTLSANIAVELPEAVLNSTHYRMLFLAALSLFVMTFFVNTIAEIVRLRFRKRAFQL